MTPDVVVRTRAEVGEGPVWDPRNDRLHWVDITAGLVHTTSYAGAGGTPSISTTTCPTWIGAVAPRRSSGLVAATRDGFAVVDATGGYDDRLPFLPDGTRMNDAACDAAGRFWAGSADERFASGQGALHVLEPDWTHRVVLDELTLPNGIGWSPDNRTLYLADTIDRIVWAFDYDLDGGMLSNKRPFATFHEGPGMPDGLCVAADGSVWVAMWAGGRIESFTPDGTRSRTLHLPVRQPSSCAFGGPNLATLFITSACDGLDMSDADLDGSLLAVTEPAVNGKEEHFFAG